MDIKNQPEPAPARPGKKRQSPAAMVPLLSKRSLKAIGIGLLAGLVAGVGLTILSPKLVGGPIWQTEVQIQLINPSSSYLPLRDFQNLGMNYYAKAGSYSFLDFLSNELNTKAPQYSHDTNTLYKMISVRYDNLSATPSFHLSVSTTSEEEAIYLVNQIPQSFKDYLINEENNNQQQQYDAIKKAVDNVTKAILQTQQELSTLVPEGAAGDIQNNANYIALDAKIRALEQQLNSQAGDLSVLIASGNITEYNSLQEKQYQTTLQQAKSINTELIKAQQELQDMNLEMGGGGASAVILNAKITALQAQIDRLMGGYNEVTGSGTTTHVLGLAEMIISNDINDINYTNTLTKIETAASAVAEAQRQLVSLQSPAVDNSTDSLNYDLAQAKVANLNIELSALKDRLTALAQNTGVVESQMNTQASFARTSAALADAKTQLAILQGRSDIEQLTKNLKYQTDKSRLQDLNNQLDDLNVKLNASLASYTNPAQVVSYLSVGLPSIPEAIEPLKSSDALLLGAVLGICGGWLVLNFRWLIKGASSFSKEEKENKETGG